MGKKGKKKRSDAKKLKKKSEKRARKAYYEGLRDSGNNSKRDRRKKKKGNNGGEKGKHLIADCGNIGCQRCHPMVRKPEVVMSITDSVKYINGCVRFKAKKQKPQRGQKLYNKAA